jgi:hypothetical protein
MWLAEASLFPAPGVLSLAIHGAFGGAILGAFLSTSPSRVSESDEAGAFAYFTSHRFGRRPMHYGCRFGHRNDIPTGAD